MEALNLAGLTPISVLRDRRTEPRKISSLPAASPLKISSSPSFNTTPPALLERFTSNFHGGLVLLSSVLTPGAAGALTYEEALNQSITTSGGVIDFDFNGFLDNLINYGVENPAVVAGGALILVVPLVLSQLLKKPKPWGVESARNAYAKLGDDDTAQLLDIRAPVEIRKVGSPDIRGLRKKPVAIPYKGGDNQGFLKKLSSKFKDPGNTTLLILDKFDGNSEILAELATVNGFKAAYAIKDGAEGPRGWMNSSLPWILPKKTSGLDLGNFTESISDALGEDIDGLSLTLGLAAATGLGFLAFSEVETLLQVLGSAAIVQFVSKKLLFAEDRKETLKQLDELLTTKIAPKEFVGEIKDIGKTLLPSPVYSNALPASALAAPEPPTSTEHKVEASAAPEINSVPKTEVKEESFPSISKPLSPYPYYPDFKPPTSPSPSQP